MQRSMVKAERPDNVPPELVVDFNVYAPPGGESDLHAVWRALQDGPDIVWSPYNGGHWLPTRFEDVDFFQRNHDPFSMREVTMPAGARPMRLLPLEADPPEHLGFRMIINPFFTPRKMADLEPFVRELAARLIAGFRDRGDCEFMSEFALHLPIAIFMQLTHLPMEDRAKLLEYTAMATRGGEGAGAEAQRLMMAYLSPIVAERRANPGDDLLSAIIHAKVGGKPISDQDMFSVLLVVLFGGLDTVASSMGFIAEFLARSPGHRRQLGEEPKLIPLAVNEMMRRFSPSNTARTLTRDYDYKGLCFREGDKIYVSPLLAGMDERRFTDAWSIDFQRREGQHASFGAGPHRCPGQLLALVEIRVFIEEWLKAIPEFELKPGDPPVYGTGQVNCVERLMLEWPA
jgi:cytochrome P450